MSTHFCIGVPCPLCFGNIRQGFFTRAPQPEPHPPTHRRTSTIAAEIAKLESEREELHDLCGAMLATFRVNVQRGTIRTEPADKTPELEALLEQFRARWMAVGMPEARDGRGE